MDSFTKYFNGTTINGRANVAKATYATIALVLIYRRLTRPAKPAAKPPVNGGSGSGNAAGHHTAPEAPAQKQPADHSTVVAPPPASAKTEPGCCPDPDCPTGDSHAGQEHKAATEDTHKSGEHNANEHAHHQDSEGHHR